jgi:hypothetical protein
VTASHWNTANVNLYHQPWTTDKKNRFFSLEAWGPVSTNPQFTAKFLGRPVNMAFKSKYKATGKEEPCICFLFPADTANPHGVARIVQPSNFVIVSPFDGYDPIEEGEVKKYKSKKDLAGGSWYKKVWTSYCSSVLPDEYKQPAPAGPVKLVEQKKKVQEKNDPTQKSLESHFAKVNNPSSSSTFSGDEEDMSVEEKNSESESDSTVEVVARASMGGKSPRHYASLEEAQKYYRARLLKEKQNDKNLNKEHRMNTANKKIAKAQNPDFDSDMDSLPDVSSASEVTEDSDFEEEVMATASKKFKEWHKTQANSQPKATKKTPPQATFATPSGKYELCLLLLTLFSFDVLFCDFFCRVWQEKKGRIDCLTRCVQKIC